MLQFDHIPKGKKAEYNKEKGEWELVGLSAENIEDLKIMLSELEAELQELKAENESLKVQAKKKK